MAAGKYVYEYPRPAVTVDVVIVTSEDKPRILLIRRKHDPFAGCWGCQAGLSRWTKRGCGSSASCARRPASRRKTSCSCTRSALRRDPRGRTISVVYLATMDAAAMQPCAADDAAEVGWFSLQRPPALAFDHKDILACARKYLRESHA